MKPLCIETLSQRRAHGGHTGKTNHTKDELMIKTDTSGGKGASVCGNQLMHPAGYSVFQGLQVIEQSERSYQHVHTQHFKTRAHQFQPRPNSFLLCPPSQVIPILPVTYTQNLNTIFNLFFSQLFPSKMAFNFSSFFLPSPLLLRRAASWSPCLPDSCPPSF